MNEIRLGSLFDGIGVFPLAAVRCGIVPAWASEIEKAPISITKRHFPGMAHLGDVTKLNGGDIPPVHIITFGSPCQNLSQIGNRAGLAGEKSSLFFHAIRIIREMREATNGIFPAIAVWENVMGAFFSNDRMDFRAVLSAFTAADISMPASGRWAGAGMVRGHTPDLAWRLMDAQHWASPRLARRQRVFVVADFGGQCSHEILFKPRAVQSISASGGNCGLPAACGDRGSFIEAGRRVPITRPFNAMAAPTRNEAERRLDFWLEACDHLNLPEFKSCRKMLTNWRRYILNAFDIHLSNGFTEGCNNAIKTLKRLAFGFRSFSTFRARILLASRTHPYI